VVEINPGYLSLHAQEPEVASLLRNPKITIVTDDGRRWLRANSSRRFDAIVSNTTWYYRANVTNLLSSEFLGLIKQHLNPGGILFTTRPIPLASSAPPASPLPTERASSTTWVVSDLPIRWDFARWRKTLEAYRIDRRPVFDTSRSIDRSELEQLQAWETSLTARNHPRPIEPCSEILARTAGDQSVTDDNMGSEWRHSLGLE